MKGALVFSLLFGGGPEHPAGDRWFGADKLQHFLVSAFVQSVSFATLEAAGADRRTALAGATVGTLAIGVGKEWHDRRGGGLFSVRDLAWDAAGVGAASLMLVHTER